MKSDVYLVYLNDTVLSTYWSHLHRFLHPGSKDETGWVSILCTHLDISHHVFATMNAKDWSENKGTVPILLRYELIMSIVKIGKSTKQYGFISEKDLIVTSEASIG